MSGTCVKERPILFSGPMVRALLDGRKTQTRRVVKVQPIKVEHHESFQRAGTVAMHFFGEMRHVACPYGSVGGRLWVRESWALVNAIGSPAKHGDYPHTMLYRATCAVPGQYKWHPSIHMHRAASRITLEITDVRVQRLNDITFADCREEGCDASYSEQVTPCKVCDGNDPCDGRHVGEKWQFSRLWESINGPGSWEQNPWVWAITFNRVDEAGQ